MSDWARRPFYTTEELRLLNSPRRYGTSPLELAPESIQCVGYMEGAFYVSEYKWHDFAYVLRYEPWQLTWIGKPGWFRYVECERIYNWLAERYDMSGWHYGEWMEIIPMPVPIAIERIEVQTPYQLALF